VTPSKPYIKARVAHMIKYFNEFDIIILQEFFGFPTSGPIFPEMSEARNLLKKMAVENEYNIIGGFDDVLKTMKNHFLAPIIHNDSGLVILSKFPMDPESISFERFEKAVGSDAFACKGIVHVKVKVAEDKYLRIFNTHLQSLDYNGSEKVNISQMTQIKKFIQEQNIDDDMIVLTGDFNTLTETVSCYLKCIVKELGLVDDNQSVGTHAPDSPMLKDEGEKGILWTQHLDWAFYRDNQQRKSWNISVRDDILVKGEPFQALSDHKPVQITLSNPRKVRAMNSNG